MTLDEAIKHADEVAEEKRYEYQDCLAVHDMENAMVCGKCGEEHEQLAKWLKELKKFKERQPCEDCISRKSAILEIQRYGVGCFDADDFNPEQAERFVINRLNDLPPIQPKAKMGKWIPIYGNVKCSVCGSVKDSRNVGKATHYCDFCGAKMEIEE